MGQSCVVAARSLFHLQRRLARVEIGTSQIDQLLGFFCLQIEQENEIGKCSEKEGCERKGENGRLGQEGKKENKCKQLNHSHAKEGCVEKGEMAGDPFESIQDVGKRIYLLSLVRSFVYVL